MRTTLIAVLLVGALFLAGAARHLTTAADRTPFGIDKRERWTTS